MLQLHKRLLDKTYGKDNKKLSESTVSGYIKALYMLNDKKPFKNLAFLKKKDEVEKKLEPYAESTKKTLYATISSVLSLYKDVTTYKSIYKYFYDKMMAKAELAGAGDTAVKTDKQSDNWMDWDKVKETLAELKADVDKFAKQKEIGESEYNKLLNYVVLSLYTELPPRRNQDYLDMTIHKVGKAYNPKKVDDLPVTSNYLLVVGNKPSKFIFNIYKTAKTYGKQVVDIPESLGSIIEMYLKRSPVKDKFLVQRNSTVLTQGNSITRILNNIFKKKIGSSMLRHIYLSSKMNIDDMKNDANLMGHSLTEQQKYLKGETSPHEPQNPLPASAPLEAV